ncbi:hypothetical protein KIL84_015030 [Mauremys mutica]|uniref:Uncharacterized protein n=1 Tax=Mauremys mutica TaxID=74926 RepID=A0A9D3XPH5_9SAUR|nr:hypothetical protein KIL84_015030 [Mauremys mutica]
MGAVLYGGGDVVRYAAPITAARGRAPVAREPAHFIALRKSPSSGEAAETAHLVAQAAVASKQSEHKDLAEKYFQESINAFKEAEGMESAKCLGAVDDFCQFLIATGQQECLYLQTLLFGSHNKRTVATQEVIDLSK